MHKHECISKFYFWLFTVSSTRIFNLYKPSLHGVNKKKIEKFSTIMFTVFILTFFLLFHSNKGMSKYTVFWNSLTLIYFTYLGFDNVDDHFWNECVRVKNEAQQIEQVDPASNTLFFLYTRSNINNPQQLFIEESSVKNNFYDSKKPTKFVTHGWTQFCDPRPMITAVTKGNYDPVFIMWFRHFLNFHVVLTAWFWFSSAYLQNGDYNVIVVDWTKISNLFYSPELISKLKSVGAQVAKMIDLLGSSRNSNPSTITLVGHSLGAHVMGFAGKQTSAKVGHIVGKYSIVLL